MKHRTFLSVALLALVLFALGSGSVARAANGAWEAWLYDVESGQVARVSDQGTVVQSLVLPDNGAGNLYSRYVAVSRDGRLIAYTVAANTNDPVDVLNEGQETLLIYDTQTAAIIYSEMLPVGALSGLQYGGSPYQFNASATSFAYGYGVLSGETFVWQVRAVDFGAATPVSYTLNSTDSLALVVPGEGYLIPVVQRFEGSTLDFLLLYGASEGSWHYPTYRWDFINAVLDPITFLYTPEADQNAVGESIMPASDPAFPLSEQPLIGFPLPNTLQAWDPLGGTLTTFAATPGIGRLSFAQSNEAIAYVEYDVATNAFTALRLIGRDGTALGSIPLSAFDVSAITDLAMTGDGFAFTAMVGDGSQGTGLYEVSTRTGSLDLMTVLLRWQSAPGENYAQLAWISMLDATVTQPVPAWGSAIPGSAPLFPGQTQTDPMTNAGIPQAPNVGGAAVVTTTEGDSLNVRSQASRSAAIVAVLPAGTVVTVIDGPVEFDGLTWWNIELPNGATGWAVGFIDTIRTLTGL